MSDVAGDSSGVEVVDDVVACGDDTQLPDGFRVVGCLSLVGIGVAQPDWVDGLICANGSLRPEPPPMHAVMCLRRMLLAAACLNSQGHGDCLCFEDCMYTTYAGLPMQIRICVVQLIVFFYFVYFITGTDDKESWKGCHGQVFCIIYDLIFNYVWGLFYCAQDTGAECAL